MMVLAAISAANSQNNPKTPQRSPLVPSDSHNGPNNPRKPKTRDICSRYLSSPSPSSPSFMSSAVRRYHPPDLPAADRRSQSAERRRPADLPAAAKLLWTSTRSLSVSFQGEFFSLPVSKIKSPAPDRRRPSTPSRPKACGGVGVEQIENSRLFEAQRWPAARARRLDVMSRSLDCGPGRRASAAVAVLAADEEQRRVDRRGSFDWRLPSADPGAADALRSASADADADFDNLSASDTESASSGSNSGPGEPPGRRRAPRGISVPARFWQETNSRLRRLQEPSVGHRPKTAPKQVQSKKTTPGCSPVSSPSKVMASSLSSPVVARGISPSRTRGPMAKAANGLLSSASSSILNFAADVRRGKMGETKIEDAHLLRLLYNRYLQWRFVNARANAATTMQRFSSEKSLYNAWATTSQLRNSVTIKRIRVQLLRQSLKLTTVLKGQMSYLEEWAHLDGDHSSSLAGAFETLKATTIRLPLLNGARVDIEKVKDAVGSTVDVLQAMGSSICFLLSKVEGMNSVVTDVVSLASQEQALLAQCKDLLSTIAALQVEECSLKANLLQLMLMPNRTGL